MKYLEALTRRKLSLDNLPKTLQKKISELNSQIEALKEIEDIPADELQDSDIEDIKQIKNNLEALDSYIEHKVNIFDQAKYERKLEQINKFSEIKKQKKEGIKTETSIEEPKVVEFDHIKEPEIEEVLVKEEAPKESTVANSQVEKEQVVENQLFEQQQTQSRTQAISQVEEPKSTPEHEEFERHGEGNPKKMTTGLILMGVGAFFLTWGAVNFFKSRR